MTTLNESLDRPAVAAPGRVLNLALWAAQILGAAMFVMSGTAKLRGVPMMVGLFDAIGFGQWFRYVTGGLEVLGAVLLLVPALAGVGGALLVPVMAGAVLTHLVVLHNSPAMPLALLAVMAFVAWGRRGRTLRLLGRA